MNKAMDLFGQAVSDYKHDKNVKFYFLDDDNTEFEHDLSRYVRTHNQLSKLEQKLASLARGRVLDIGCGTANYFPVFASKDVTGVEISQTLADMAIKAGNNCICTDIYSYNPSQKYDTITFLENNIGMAGTPKGLEKLIIKLDTLLAPNGNIYAMQMRVGYSGAVYPMRPKYKNIVGERFTWLNINTIKLRSVFKDYGFKLEIIGKDKTYNLLKITRYKQ
jgi:SAM-dependent methyltransferase